MELKPSQTLLVYDGECGFCSGVARTMSRLDWRGKLAAIPFQTEGLVEELGMSEERVRASAQALTPSGTLLSRGGSIAATLDVLLPIGLPLFQTLYRLPGLHTLADWLYDKLSQHRSKLARGPAELSRKPRPALDEGLRQELRRRRMSSRMPSAGPGPALVFTRAPTRH